jgi:hypothetical protein
MDAWSWVWGAVVGFGLFVLAGLIFVKILEWVLPTIPRNDPCREEDEDEVDHRFY